MRLLALVLLAILPALGLVVYTAWEQRRAAMKEALKKFRTQVDRLNHIVGPLFRIKRLVNDVAGGRLKVPEYPLRDGDELKDVFDAVTAMVRGLRERQEADASAVGTMIERASRSKAAMELVPELQELEAKIRARLS